MGEGETFQAEGRDYARVGRRKHSKWKEMKDVNLECKTKGKYTVMGRLLGPPSVRALETTSGFPSKTGDFRTGGVCQLINPLSLYDFLVAYSLCF